MVKYLKYIVLVFGGIGVMAASFFYFQNKTDITAALEYRSKIDYTYLNDNCKFKENDYLFNCIKNEFRKYLDRVSLTGTSIGMKMVFNVMDEDRERTTFFVSEEVKALHFSINYLEINNLAMGNAYKRYFGFDGLYAGFIGSLQRYYKKAYEFNANIIIGLEGEKGIKTITDPSENQKLIARLEAAKKEFYRLKDEVQNYTDAEVKRLEALDIQ